MTAAAAFAVGARRLQSIDLFEQLDKMLNLQVNSDRHLHPHLYDWPAAGATRADAGLPILDWSADEAGVVANRILDQFHVIKAHSNNLSVKTKRSVKAIEPLGDFGCRLVVEGAPAEGGIYDAAIIAVGFGYEKETSGENQSYWAPSRLTGPLRPYPRPVLFISGNGDGGLVDFTMAAFNRMTHSEITAFLTACEGLEDAHQALLQIEERAWQDAEEKVDFLAEYKSLPLPPRLLLDVYDYLRPDTEVWLHTHEPRLFRRKTAILNRFTAFLAIAADERRDRGLVHVCVGPSIEGSANHGAIKIGDTSIAPLHRFLRFGSDNEANMLPFQTLSQKYKDAHPDKMAGFRTATPRLQESALLRFTTKSTGLIAETPVAEQIQPPEAPNVPTSHVLTPVALVETKDRSPFRTAGMLEDDDPTYVPRECDHQLAEFLDNPEIVCIAINGDFQIGKSSLMMRAARVLGSDWIAVGGGLGDLRSDKLELCVGNFFQLFESHFGQIHKWSELRQRLVKQPVLLRLDDLGQMHGPGARAILPHVIEAADVAKGKLRVVATLPVRIDQYLLDCGLVLTCN
jgi:hypothetical protein